MNDRFVKLDALPLSVRNCVLTIGNFDGVHAGHRRIMDMARSLANGGPVVALTFDPPPDLVIRPADAPLRLTPHAVKCGLLVEAGCDYVVTAAASMAILSLTPEQFARQIILDTFSPTHMVEGPNFFFGRKRSGSIETLRKIGAREGFDVHVADPVRMQLAGGEKLVSSTLIRGLVSEGNVEEAAVCLGRPFTLYGRVVRGFGRGKQLAYPTANLRLGDQVAPADGVYAGLAEIDGDRMPAAISVGAAPTFCREAEGKRVVEAHLLADVGDIYGRAISVAFTRRLREQRRFDDLDALKDQMARDVEQVRSMINEMASNDEHR